MKKILPAICGINGDGFASMALKSDGTVWAWGNNDRGQLGDGTKRKRNFPAQVKELDEVIAIAPRQALRSDGTVWCWGYNREGQCGDGTNSPRLTPVQVKDLYGVKAIYAGTAVRDDGTVWTWGHNNYGQLGDGTTKNRRNPVQVKNLDKIKEVSCTLALREDGTVWEWGTNCLEIIPLPRRVPHLENVVAISKFFSSYALKEDGTVWAWGQNISGRLGDGTDIDRYEPIMVKGLDRIIAISTGSSHQLALRHDGTVWVWGGNLYGQFGNGTFIEDDDIVNGCPHSLVLPTQIQGLNDVIAVSAGTQHSLALKSDGTIWACGRNIDGELGDGTKYSLKYNINLRGGVGSSDMFFRDLVGKNRKNEIVPVSKYVPIQVVGIEKEDFIDLLN